MHKLYLIFCSTKHSPLPSTTSAPPPKTTVSKPNSETITTAEVSSSKLIHLKFMYNLITIQLQTIFTLIGSSKSKYMRGTATKTCQPKVESQATQEETSETSSTHSNTSSRPSRRAFR